MSGKRKPTGFTATCQCGKTVGAMDYERIQCGDAARILGRWLMDGCTVTPQLTPDWRAHVEACQCAPTTGSQS